MSGLYVHIPFCERKCIYCSFYSIESFANRDRFVSALLKEIGMVASSTEGTPQGAADPGPIESIFLGGGTPSILSPEEIGSILDALRTAYDLRSDAEITMECNPGALRRDWLEGYRAAGINRLSFGVQSFHDDELTFLSRIHTAAEAEENIRLVRDVFENVSLDLIFALPNQTPEGWRHNLERAVALGTDHISAYSLIFEEGTPLNAARIKGRVRPAPDDTEADMYEETVEFLNRHGFAQYETSNYAKPGRECRHNIGYWERENYVSFGPSAHSFVRSERKEPGRRWANVSSLTAYLNAVESDRLPIVSIEELAPETATEEIVMLGLRCRGIDLEEFRTFAGGDLERLAPNALERMLSGGYAAIDEGRLKLHPKGTIFADRFALEIIDETERSPHTTPL